MQNIPSIVKLEAVKLSDILLFISNIDENSVLIKFAENSPPFILPLGETSIQNSFATEKQDGITSYTHKVSCTIPMPLFDFDTKNYISQFKIEGGILLLTDTDGNRYVAGSKDSPLQLLSEHHFGDSASAARCYALNFTGIQEHSALFLETIL